MSEETKSYTDGLYIVEFNTGIQFMLRKDASWCDIILGNGYCVLPEEIKAGPFTAEDVLEKFKPEPADIEFKVASVVFGTKDAAIELEKENVALKDVNCQLEEIADEQNDKIVELKKENRRLRKAIEILVDALSLAHTELTKDPDWPETRHQRFVSETIEQALNY